MMKKINWNELFVEVSQEYWNSLYKFCVTLVRDKIAAEDLHQSALLKALNAFEDFVIKYAPTFTTATELKMLFLDKKINYHFKNWLYKIIKNTFLDQVVASKKLQYTDKPPDYLPVNTCIDQSNTSIDKPDKQLLKREEDEFYKLALDDEWIKKIASLNTKQRSILFLVAEGYSYKEIAYILELPSGTIMSSLSRAIKKLKEMEI